MNGRTALVVVLLLIGIFMLIFISLILGLVVIVVGLVMLHYNRRNAARLLQNEPTGYSSTPSAPTAVGGQEMAKVRCKYCGTVNDQTKTSVCSNCGAPLS